MSFTSRSTFKVKLFYPNYFIAALFLEGFVVKVLPWASDFWYLLLLARACFWIWGYTGRKWSISCCLLLSMHACCRVSCSHWCAGPDLDDERLLANPFVRLLLIFELRISLQTTWHVIAKRERHEWSKHAMVHCIDVKTNTMKGLR